MRPWLTWLQSPTCWLELFASAMRSSPRYEATLKGEEERLGRQCKAGLRKCCAAAGLQRERSRAGVRRGCGRGKKRPSPASQAEPPFMPVVDELLTGRACPPPPPFLSALEPASCAAERGLESPASLPLSLAPSLQTPPARATEGPLLPPRQVAPTLFSLKRASPIVTGGEARPHLSVQIFLTNPNGPEHSRVRMRPPAIRQPLSFPPSLVRSVSAYAAPAWQGATRPWQNRRPQRNVALPAPK